ncbi:MAG: ABC transporter substrate-binding protein [Candidatus Bipolaricaulota bacterium]
MRAKWMAGFVALLLFAVGVVAQQTPIKIGVVQVLTGPLSANGIDGLRGAQMAVLSINRAGGVLGRPLEIVVEDSKGEVAAAVAAAERMAYVHKVPVVAETNFSFLLNAAQETYRDAGIPFVGAGTSPALTKIGNPYLFRIRHNDVLPAQAAVKHAVEVMGAKRLAIAHVIDDFGRGARDALIAAMRSLYGIEPVAVVGIPLDIKDATGPVVEVAAANPDVVFVWAHAAQGGLFFRSRYELGYANIPVIGSVVVAAPATIELAGIEAMEGAMFVGDFALDAPKVALFNNWYYELHGESVLSEVGMAVYDAVHLIAKAIEKAGVVDSQAIRDALIGIEMEGVLRSYSVRSDGETTFELTIGQIRNGKSSFVSPVRFPTDIKY